MFLALAILLLFNEAGSDNVSISIEVLPVIAIGTTTIVDNDNVVTFSQLTPGSTSDTTPADSNDALIVANEGNVLIDIAISSDTLFDTTTPSANGTEYYQFNVSDYEAGAIDDTYGRSDAPTWTNVSTDGVTRKAAAQGVNFEDSKDEIRIDFKVTVPLSEGAGNKNATVVVYAVQDTLTVNPTNSSTNDAAS